MGKERDSFYYDEIFKSSKQYGLDAKNMIYYENWLKSYQYIKSHGIKNVVDLGCGSGHFPSIFEEGEQITYKGYDFSSVAIEQAKAKQYNNGNDIQFYVKDLSDCDIDECKLYVSFEFLEHVSFDLELLNTIPEGSELLFSVPSFDSNGHVRTYPTEKDVTDRYSSLFDLELINITKIKHHSIYLYKGLRNGN